MIQLSIKEQYKSGIDGLITNNRSGLGESGEG